MDRRILLWTAEASQVLGDSFDLLLPVLESSEFDLADGLVRQLCGLAHTSSESVLILVRADRPWGAEMIVRSVAEGTVKAVYLEIAAEGERVDLAEDFWHAGLALAHLKDDEKLRAFLRHVDSRDERWRFYRERLFTPEEKANVDAAYPPAVRRDHGRRWSFKHICDSLGDSDNSTYETLAYNAYLYSVSSHVLHADAFAVAIAADRYRRSAKERDAIAAAHACRMVSDLVSFAFARVTAVDGRRGLESDKVRDWSTRAQRLLADMEPAHAEYRTAVSAIEDDTLPL